ncbi:5-amino-6-(D-ribitylamino)uracil--L-tyrosine 4-hydroxyphenyl transferase CofH [Nitrososphaera sp.]|uniref:5-amino-6-(D-ribitylamino)uracil--L-tyrosine 4-hydroxyphenyl transferase CofH n=1 Tax=Nitrososphaera sp. TaxID=1971748 RepID=UPI0018333669|nr:5-amino-6-(D-ribitylamino)uracil--L-tyrosine 4-hydroxyphenyl transferase CofH [Nitrososphaera sp.]
MQMALDALLKSADPVVASALGRALDGKDVSVDEAVALFDSTGLEMSLTVAVADELRKRAVGDIVTYVVNRNINFTNVCIKQCGFCAFSRDFREEEGYFLPNEEIVRRAKEAASLGATEVCIQAGLPPKMDGHLYVDICKAVKKELPDIHIHAFSPEEVLYGAVRSETSTNEYLKMLKEAGVGSLPGTAAEILNQPLRDIISPGRIKVDEWVSIIRQAHALGIPTTSTIMYGHIENSQQKAEHIALLRDIQKETHGFTEFVPLSFVHTEAPMYSHRTVDNIRAGADGFEVIKMHAVARIMLNNHIPNIQVSWVKEGARMSQLLLAAGANDFGGTLINESISTAAGAQHGQLMRPKEIRQLIRSAGRIPAQRSTSYKLLKVYKDEGDDDESALDSADPSQFGSYQQLIKLDKFRFKKQ